SGNTALGRGGGISGYRGSANLTNCTVSSNSAHLGGGIFSYYDQVSLTDSTVSGNSASKGGGLFQAYSYIRVAFQDTIVPGNTDPRGGRDVSAAVPSLGHNLIGQTDGSTGWGGSDLTGTSAAPLDPLLAPLGDYGGPTLTMALFPGSPALGAGVAVAGITTD